MTATARYQMISVLLQTKLLIMNQFRGSESILIMGFVILGFVIMVSVIFGFVITESCCSVSYIFERHVPALLSITTISITPNILRLRVRYNEIRYNGVRMSTLYRVHIVVPVPYTPVHLVLILDWSLIRTSPRAQYA